MSQIEEAVYNILTNDATVAGLVSTRIYPVVAPQDVALPAIAYQRISDLPWYAHDGDVGLARCRLQITAMDDDYSGAKSLAAAIKAALGGYNGTAATVRIYGALLDNELDDKGLTDDIYSVIQDYMITRAT